MVALAEEEWHESRLEQDLDELVKPRVHVQWPEHVWHVQWLPVAALHRREERVWVSELPEVAQ